MEKKLKELAREDDPDSIPLADDDPSDVIEESFLSEDKRREMEWRKKMDFESLDSIPSILSDRSDLGAGGSGQLSEQMNRQD